MFQSAVIHAEYEFASHNAVINGVCYNRHQDCFVSTDDTCLRLWSAAKGELRRVELPARTSNFIQAIEYVDSRQLYVAAALDGTLKMYDTGLTELASVFTGRGTILTLSFDVKHNRLLSGGVDGCAAWLVRGKPMAENGINPHYELSLIPGFFTHAPDAIESLDEPSSEQTASSTIASNTSESPTRRKSSNSKASGGGATGRKKGGASGKALPHQRAWVQNVHLNAERTKLYAQSKQCVDVFSAADGRFIETYSDLFPKEYGAIMAFVVHEKTHYLVCGCLNGWIFIVSLHPISVVHVFKDHTMSVTGLVVHTSSNLVLSSSLDGTVRLWDLEARRQAHRLDIGQPVQEIQLLVAHANPCRFYCRVRSAVHLFRIQSAIKEHLPALSPICVLQRVLYPTHTDAVLQPRAGAIGSGGNVHQATKSRSLMAQARSGTNVEQGSSSEDDLDYEDDPVDDGHSEDEDENRRQVIVAAGMDKTIRLFTGRTANEAPSFTWIPEEAALDMVGFALNPVGKHLFLLLESQKIVVVDVSVHEKEESSILRVVEMGAQPMGFGTNSNSSSKPGGGTGNKTASSRDLSGSRRGQHTTTSRSSSSSSANSWIPPRGGIKCICVCYYPPIFRSAAPSASATAHVTPAAQSKWFSRTFVNRRQPSSVAQELKKVQEEKLANEQASSANTAGHRRNALIQSEYEWVVCGSEFGHLLFWHTGLTNNGKEAISLDAHDAAIIAVATSTSSPLLVSLDEAKRVSLWYFQPVFMLRHMLDLSERPSCFALSPRSELLLAGYEDGNVTLMDVSDPSNVVTHANDENHFAMVSAADFLDEKAIVLTASVDAMIKIWDQEKNLLRQLNIAMAFTSLCFMNASGDVMAGLSNGIFIVTRDDVLPEKPAKQKRARKEHTATTTSAVGAALTNPNQKEDLTRDPASVDTGKAFSGDGTGNGKKAGRIESKKTSTSVAQPQPPPKTVGDTSTETETTLSSWKKPKEPGDVVKWLTYVDRPLAAIEHAPVLRPIYKPKLPDASDGMSELPAVKPKTPMRRQVQ